MAVAGDIDHTIVLAFANVGANLSIGNRKPSVGESIRAKCMKGLAPTDFLFQWKHMVELRVAICASGLT
jgi:hypothetical protein